MDAPGRTLSQTQVGVGRQASVSFECSPGDSNGPVPTTCFSEAKDSDLPGHRPNLQEAQ